MTIPIGSMVAPRPLNTKCDAWTPVRDAKMNQIGTMLEGDIAVVLSYEVPPRAYYTRGAWVYVLFGVCSVGWVPVENVTQL